MTHCKMCARILNIEGRPWTLDCGGDCLVCMAAAGDPECIVSVDNILATHRPMTQATRYRLTRAARLGRKAFADLNNDILRTLALEWNKARLAACAAPLGNATVWTALGNAETALAAHLRNLET